MKNFFFFIINKFNLIFLKIHLLILYRIYFSEIRRIIKNILLFVNYIKFGPQYFWLLYIYIFSISSLKIWFLYQFWSLFFWLLFVFFLILLLIKFFIYHIWSLFFWLLFILFEIIYEIFFFNFIIFFFYL
jgi:hypothetical protein